MQVAGVEPGVVQVFVYSETGEYNAFEITVLPADMREILGKAGSSQPLTGTNATPTVVDLEKTAQPV